ncbi:hypothetical protein EMCRGX_G031856 [Ephydatia muelleri]|eukprot:Em0018g153a
MIALLIAVSLCSLVTGGAAQLNPGKITNLPGANFTIDFDQYAGFITVNKSHGRALFYWFVASQGDPSNDPVVLWLNGGPGCSSLGGFFTELGPFYPLRGGSSLASNPYSWNKVANMIFLESPSGVGFSYSNTTSDYVTGDQQTTQDSLEFLIQFFHNYPEFAANPFWITGESYGGHYVPWLAKAVLDYNAGKPQTPINLKGFMAGNPWTDTLSDNSGTADYWYSHALISPATYLLMLQHCDFSKIGPLIFGVRDPPQDACGSALAKASAEIGDINLYDLYADVCLKDGEPHFDRQTIFRPPKLRNHNLPGDQDPCIENYETVYLNRPEVREAIHASASPNKWMDCSVVVNYSNNDLLASALFLYKDFLTLQTGLEILVYSGDVDGVVAHPGTQAWIGNLTQYLQIKEDWKPWMDSTSQVGGRVVHYDKMTFATVRNAGHMVPSFQPLRALEMFSQFLSGKF